MNELELQRRENLRKIEELGFEPFPAAMFDVNYRSQTVTTAEYQKRLAKKLEEIKGIGAVGAEKLRDAFFKNGSKAERVLGNEEIVAELKISEQVEFDKGVKREAMSLQEYFDTAKAEAIGVDGTVRIAGRFMGQRGPFAQLQDAEGRIQLYIGKKNLADTDEEIARYQKLVKLLDIGDFIGVEGAVFSTGTGEVSIKVSKLTFLGKTLRPLPVVKRDKEGNIYDEFKDPEQRYRMRYVDLTVNPQFKDIFVKRTRLIKTIRNFLDDLGLMEVETPILQAIHGGAAARPFKTHHNTLDMPMYMRIANELYLKRLIVAGFDGVYELSKMFRNEGMDRTHNPEFSMVEFYVAYKDYLWMMDRTEELFEQIATNLHGTTKVTIGENEIDFKGPYRRLTMYDSIKEYTGETVDNLDEAALRTLCKKWHIDVDPSMGRGKLIDEIFGEKVEPNLIQPTFITDYPQEMSPLTKKHRSKEGLVERFELMVNGQEVANAYSELNDPIDQRERFEAQIALAKRGDDEAMPLDEDFLRALEFGMPPCSGIGIGIDRLTMLMTGQTSIQEVLFFPQMRMEK